MRIPTRLAALLLTPLALPAQSARELAVSDTSPFRALALPAPSDVRAGSGRPGARYWQQRVDYRITASLDSATSTVRGRGTIHYVNRSPDALPYLWLFLEQNICAPASITNVLNQPPLVFAQSSFDFSCAGLPAGSTGGLVLDSIRLGLRTPAHASYGTTMRVELPAPLAPGAAVDLDLAWHFAIPEQGAGRMGRDGPLVEVAQWYPRVAVYDDVRGWNHEPYIGAGEFYLEYGSFDVSLTVPASYVVAATGQLQNPLAVLTAAQRARLAAARRSDTTVAVITRAEAGDVPRTRPARRGTLTWHFTADSVRDFAWAASPGLLWDASGVDGILVETLYRPNAAEWGEANRYARGAIEHLSRQWYRYPYSHATTVEGPIQGMEYPMLTFVPNAGPRENQEVVLAHEFGHEWFPMIVGSNERLYPWMDEGFNTFITAGSQAAYFAGTPLADTVWSTFLHLYPAHAIPGAEQPLATNPTGSRDLFWTAYQKPALMLTLLREEVVGRERFDYAFRAYIRAWAFKHPTPADFFRVMRDASGMELDWFWREWIYETARLDVAVDSIAPRAEGGSTVHLTNRGTMVMPTELSLELDDGTRSVVRLPVEMWNLGARFAYRVPGAKRVRRAVVDPRGVMPDVDRSNDAWPRGGR